MPERPDTWLLVLMKAESASDFMLAAEEVAALPFPFAFAVLSVKSQSFGLGLWHGPRTLFVFTVAAVVLSVTEGYSNAGAYRSLTSNDDDDDEN